MPQLMPSLPPPDPHESHEPAGLELGAPAVLFLNGPSTPEMDRIASAMLDWRPGALVVVTPG
jgi:hypothetical protein